MPDTLVIARHSFIDVGPPFDFYDLTQVKSSEDGLSVERVSVTPTGQSCIQPATVKDESVTLHETMAELLANKNPCAISEKDLHRELKRRKKHPVFSGMNVTMQVNCNGRERHLRMDVLDRDLFDSAPNTPANTSWTMGVMGELDKALGRGVWDRPMFNLGTSKASKPPGTELVRAVREGKFDGLFGKEQHVSQIALEADEPVGKPPAVVIESVTPIGPISPRLPIYPPIAKAAHVGGLVAATFEISAEGKVGKVAIEGPKMLQQAVGDAVSGWQFPRSIWGKSAQARIRFDLNCLALPPSTNR